jgi:hypothetical protein
VRVRRLTTFIAVATVALVTAIGLSAAAAAETIDDEQRGAELAKAVSAGERSCDDLTGAELESIGEYAMGLRFADASDHEAMDERMRQMMGEAGVEAAHETMGRMAAGCKVSERDAYLMMPQMMMGGYGGGMMGSGMMGYGDGPRGMMGGGDGSRYGYGMMGDRDGWNDHHDVDVWVVVVIALLTAVLASLLTWALIARDRKSAGGE